MKSKEQVQAMHDTIVNLLNSDDVNTKLHMIMGNYPEVKTYLENYLATLCWILDHPTPFTENLDGLNTFLRRIGYEIMDINTAKESNLKYPPNSFPHLN